MRNVFRKIKLIWGQLWALIIIMLLIMAGPCYVYQSRAENPPVTESVPCPKVTVEELKTWEVVAMANAGEFIVLALVNPNENAPIRYAMAAVGFRDGVVYSFCYLENNAIKFFVIDEKGQYVQETKLTQDQLDKLLKKFEDIFQLNQKTPANLKGDSKWL